MLLKRLVDLLEAAHISDGIYGIVDKNQNLIAGRRGAGYQLRYENKWVVRDLEDSRGVVYYEKLCDSEREACIEFLNMTDIEFHLASHIPEFAA